jgi:hypothetical protein
MFKIMKVYELEKSLKMPPVHSNDWQDPIVEELASYDLKFLVDIAITQQKIFTLRDLIENKYEIEDAMHKRFSSENTKKFVQVIAKIYTLSQEVSKYFDMQDYNDLVAFVHTTDDTMQLYSLKKVFDKPATEKEWLEIICGELSAFGYSQLCGIALSRKGYFSREDLIAAGEEMKKALKERFVSERTMAFVEFLYLLYQRAKRIMGMPNEDFIFQIEEVMIV